MHYADSIEKFGSPNGTCSSQMEAKHIPVVKEPWRQSNRNSPLDQMLKTINHMDKLAAIWSVFRDWGMLARSVIDHMDCQAARNLPPPLPWSRTTADEDDGLGYGMNKQDVGPATGS
jgi:hypothetical protein